MGSRMPSGAVMWTGSTRQGCAMPSDSTWIIPRLLRLSAAACGCAFVDSALEHAASGDLGEKLVGHLLFVEALAEPLGRIGEIQMVGECQDRSVGCDLVVLDTLGRRDQRGVLGHRV